MSCGNPHETDCADVLGRVSDFLDHRLSGTPSVDYADIEQHLQECHPCLEQYGVQVEELQQAVRAVLSRCCGHDHAPDELRLRVLARIRVGVVDTGSG
jgi:mycothiol system anti-sigma-R factor